MPVTYGNYAGPLVSQNLRDALSDSVNLTTLRVHVMALNDADPGDADLTVLLAPGASHAANFCGPMTGQQIATTGMLRFAFISAYGKRAAIRPTMINCEYGETYTGWRQVTDRLIAEHLSRVNLAAAEPAPPAPPAIEEELRSIATARSTTALETLRRQIDADITDLDITTRNAANLRDRIRGRQIELDAIQARLAKENPTEKLVEQLELIRSHAFYASERLTENKLRITTTDNLRITRPDTGESRHLGTFEIVMDLSGQANIEIHNLSTRRGGRDHPHVSNGRPCLGAHSDEFYDALLADDLYLLFDLVIQYLQTLNIYDEWGSYGAYWFDAEDERPVEQDAEVTA